MTNKKYINKGLDWALSKKAQKLLQELIDAGADFDLAYAILEEELTENDLYDLPARKEE